MKIFRSALITFCFAGAICLAIPKADANHNVVINPGFENSAMFAPNWTYTDPNPDPDLSNVGTDPQFANSGNNHANLGTFGVNPLFASLSQTLMTTAGQLYNLSFWLAHDVTTPPPPVSNNFQVFFGGVMVQSLVNVGTFGYTQFVFGGLVPTGGSTLLEFRFRDGNDFFRLDDVRVSTPESGATALLALPAFAGLLLLHFRLRTRKSSVS